MDFHMINGNLFLLLLICQYICLYETKISRVYNANCKNASLVRISMIGDSLMRRPMEYYNLPDQIHDYLINLNPNLIYNITYNTTAIDGSQIEAIKRQQVNPVIEWKPDAWIMYWDTDVSNVDEWEQSQRDIDIERQSFNGNLSYVLQRLTTEIPDLEYRCAVAGPGVLGDDRAVKPKEFLHKVKMIGDYIGFYENQTVSWGCTYINIRNKYLQNIPKFYNSYPGHSWARRFVMPRFQVTTGEPGEHPNFRGASKDAQQWANQIFTWFYANCSNLLPLGSDDDYYL